MNSGPILNILEILFEDKYMYMYKKSVTAAWELVPKWMFITEQL